MPISSLALLAANLIPLVGVIFFGWDTVLVLALFWIENLIIGAFNILKIVGVSLYRKDKKGLFLTPFFMFHYGAFCSVHGMLLSDLLGLPKVNITDYLSVASAGVLDILLRGAAIFLNFIELLSPAIWLGLAGLALSHFVSFIENFILRGEIFDFKPGQLMTQPYSKIVIMHIGLVLGAVILSKLNSPVWLLAVIVLIKIVVDYQQHRKRHQRADQLEQIKDI